MGKKLLINGVIIIGAIGAGVFVSMKPWQVYQQQSQDAKARVHEMREAENRRDELLEKEARLQSSVGREELARKAGYLAPGEVASEDTKKTAPSPDQDPD